MADGQVHAPERTAQPVLPVVGGPIVLGPADTIPPPPGPAAPGRRGQLFLVHATESELIVGRRHQLRQHGQDALPGRMHPHSLEGVLAVRDG